MAGSGKVNLTTGNPLKKVFVLSIPLIISKLMHVLYNIVDTAWLGMLGKEEVAAMAFVFPVIFFVISIGIGIGIAGSVLVAQYEGAGEEQNVNFAAAQTFSFTFFITIIISVIGYFRSADLVILLGATESVVPLAEAYLKVIFSGLIFLFAFFIFNSLMRGWGNTLTPMKIMVVTNILNIILDPLLIFGIWIFPRLGIAGAAYATVFSRIIAAAAGLYILFRGKHALKLQLPDFMPQLKVIKKLFLLGWPAIVEHALKAVGIMILTGIVAVFGTVYVAAFGIGTRVFSVVIMLALAVSMAVASAVGQNLGAGLPRRARDLTRVSSITVGVVLIFFGVAIYYGNSSIASLFMRAGDKEVIETAGAFLKRLAFAAPFIGVVITMRGAFKGAGRTLQSMFIGISGLLGVRVLYAWFAGVQNNNPNGIWNAFIVSGIIEVMICIIYYLKGNWAVPAVELSPANSRVIGVPEENELTE